MIEFWISTIILSAACIWYKSSCWSSCFWSGFQYVQCCMKQSVVKHAGEEILTNETYLRIKAVFTTYLCCCLQSYYLQLPPHKLACEVRLSYALAFKVKLLLPCLVICCQFVWVILSNNVERSVSGGEIRSSIVRVTPAGETPVSGDHETMWPRSVVCHSVSGLRTTCCCKYLQVHLIWLSQHKHISQDDQH